MRSKQQIVGVVLAVNMMQQKSEQKLCNKQYYCFLSMLTAARKQSCYAHQFQEFESSLILIFQDWMDAVNSLTHNLYHMNSSMSDMVKKM